MVDKQYLPLEAGLQQAFRGLAVSQATLTEAVSESHSSDSSGKHKSLDEQEQGALTRTFVLQCFDRFDNPCNSGMGAYVLVGCCGRPWTQLQRKHC